MYTANLVEVLYNVIRRNLKKKEAFPTEDTEAKLTHLAVKMHEKAIPPCAGGLQQNFISL